MTRSYRQMLRKRETDFRRTGCHEWERLSASTTYGPSDSYLRSCSQGNMRAVLEVSPKSNSRGMCFRARLFLSNDQRGVVLDRELGCFKTPASARQALTRAWRKVALRD